MRQTRLAFQDPVHGLSKRVPHVQKGENSSAHSVSTIDSRTKSGLTSLLWRNPYPPFFGSCFIG